MSTFMNAIGSVLTDARLRESLISKVSQRVKDFSWDRAAQSYLDLLDQTRPGT
jgi:hypothetical protein